jgi:hypothetical protein
MWHMHETFTYRTGQIFVLMRLGGGGGQSHETQPCPQASVLMET